MPNAVNVLGGTVSYTEGSAAVVLDSDVTVQDAELDALNSGLGNYSGATLTLARHGGANAQDVFSTTGSLSALTQGGTFSVGGTAIGTVDTYLVDNPGDSVVENAGAGTDTVQSSSVSYTLAANVENLQLLGGWISGTGNNLANRLTGTRSDNRLSGGLGDDILDGSDGIDTLYGGAGADTLKGGAANDIFVFDSKIGADTVTTFVSGAEKLKFSQAALPVGDGDTILEGAVALAGPGGFLKTAELVIVSQNIGGGITAASAAAAIGPATTAYAAGAHALFAVDNGSQSAVYYFTAANANAAVEANELLLVATLSATAGTVLADYGLTA
jgi:Ca2+-binding RTX toxin-like protein